MKAWMYTLLAPGLIYCACRGVLQEHFVKAHTASAQYVCCWGNTGIVNTAINPLHQIPYCLFVGCAGAAASRQYPQCPFSQCVSGRSTDRCLGTEARCSAVGRHRYRGKQRHCIAKIRKSCLVGQGFTSCILSSLVVIQFQVAYQGGKGFPSGSIVVEKVAMLHIGALFGVRVHVCA